jgi:hypothetical protein
VNINKLHRIFGHVGKELLWKTADFCGIKFSGKLQSCEDVGLMSLVNAAVEILQHDKASELEVEMTP